MPYFKKVRDFPYIIRILFRRYFTFFLRGERHRLEAAEVTLEGA